MLLLRSAFVVAPFLHPHSITPRSCQPPRAHAHLADKDLDNLPGGLVEAQEPRDLEGLVDRCTRHVDVGLLDICRRSNIVYVTCTYGDQV